MIQEPRKQCWGLLSVLLVGAPEAWSDRKAAVSAAMLSLQPAAGAVVVAVLVLSRDPVQCDEFVACAKRHSESSEVVLR